MKNDIQTRNDLHLIVDKFYQKLLVNKELKHFFIKFNNPETLKAHLGILVDFWDNVLFYSGTYQKNAMKPHLEMNLITPIKKEHFKTWLMLFNESVDSHFKGENATVIKNRALSIATVMELKVGGK